MAKHTLTLNPARYSASCSCGWSLIGDVGSNDLSSKTFTKIVNRLHDRHVKPPLMRPEDIGLPLVPYKSPTTKAKGKVRKSP